jgi:hypothetical protein
MRDRADFIENLRQVYTHLLILTEDIKYPLPEERQEWLDGATLLIRHLHNLEMKDDIEKVLRKMGERAGEVE